MANVCHAIEAFIFKISLLFVFAVFALAAADAQTLRQAAPEDVGMSKECLDRIRPAMETHIQENHMAGAVGLVLRDGKIAYLESFGTLDQAAGKPMRKDAIFRIYSMTKAL
jgi:CubicO group peptidase (beta-lactamase class C family)